MFKFNFRESFPCPAREIFERSLYNFDEYVKFSPDVTRVDVLSRVAQPDGREKISLQVFAKTVLPAPVRAVFNMSEMSWNEQYIVDPEKLTADWSVETPIFTEYVDCEGTSSIEDVPNGCLIHITGAMTIRVMPMMGIPRPVVQTMVNIMEPFVGNMITFNLKKYFKSVRSCVEKEKAAEKKRVGA